MRRFLILLSVIFLTFLTFAKDYRYRYQFYPLPKANLYIKGKKAVISSKGLTISVEQVEDTPFSKYFKVFQLKPNFFFTYFKIKIINNSNKKVYLDPNFISLISNKKEYRKPLLYNDMYRALAKEYSQNEINPVLNKYLLDFQTPVYPGKRISAYLVFRNFREKAKNAMLKFDAVTIGFDQTTFLIIYSLKGERIDEKKLFKKNKDF